MAVHGHVGLSLTQLDGGCWYWGIDQSSSFVMVPTLWIGMIATEAFERVCVMTSQNGLHPIAESSLYVMVPTLWIGMIATECVCGNKDDCSGQTSLSQFSEHKTSSEVHRHTHVRPEPECLEGVLIILPHS